jgi:hypothetical protein
VKKRIRLAAIGVCACFLFAWPAEPRETIDVRVKQLIEKTQHEATEADAFRELEALRCQAVPAIIKNMDDRRLLPKRYIALENKSPQAFESIRQYGPERVVDALAAILNQVTGQHFGFIYNGASDVERAKTVAGWREYLAKTPAARLCQ